MENNSNRKQSSIGAAWTKKTKTGKVYLSVTVKLDGQDYQLGIFKNDYKTKPTDPDYRIIQMGAQGGYAAPRQSPAGYQRNPAPAAAARRNPPTEPVQQELITEDENPF